MKCKNCNTQVGCPCALTMFQGQMLCSKCLIQKQLEIKKKNGNSQ